MLDENFIVSVYMFVIRVKCKLGFHCWDRMDDSKGEHTAAASIVWDDANCIEFYKCYDCGKEKMVWEDFWGIRHKVKLDK